MDILKLKDSYDSLDSIEEHFKIEAGPGAGKTTFLARHVKRVLTESTRLKSTRKVACITYTNVGVHSLRERLGKVSHEVEVSTIHSFLYRHVLKPYSWLLDEWPFEDKKIPTLYRQRLSGNFIGEILRETNDSYLFYKQKVPLNKIREVMEKAKWLKINNEYEFKLVSDYQRKLEVSNDEKGSEKRWLKQANIDFYREKCHEAGILLYEDVLYFSYLLIKRYEEIREIIRAKFPYIFIDEFQDTTSLQTDILKYLSEKEVVLGVIGDKYQSIYGFTGATVQEFNDWKLPKMKTYTIQQNRRAHDSIVKVLNSFKKNGELNQTPIRSKITDGKPLIIPGTLEEATIYCRGKWEEEFLVLGYNFDKTIESYNPKLKDISFKKFLDFLSDDSKRGRKIRATLKVIEAFNQFDYTKAIKKITSLQKRDTQLNEEEALKYLEVVRKTYNQYLDKPLKKYYMEVLFELRFADAGRISDKGRPSRKYSISLKEALSAISIEDRKYQEVQTIHSMKGDEADNILVSLPSKSFKFLMDPDLSNKDEEHRVYYVAASRARENLAFQVEQEYFEEIKGIDKNLFRVIRRDEIKAVL